MKLILTILLFFMSISINAQNIDLDLLKIKQRIDSILQFSAKLKLDIDINFINMPTKYASMNYSKGKPIKFSSNDFVMIPKRGLDFSLNRLFEYSFITVPRGDIIKNGIKYKALNIIPTDQKADYTIALLLLDIPNLRVAETEISTKKDGTYNVLFNYENTTKILPALVEVRFEIERIKIPINFMGKDTDIDRKKMKSEGVKIGKIFLSISNYIIKHS